MRVEEDFTLPKPKEVTQKIEVTIPKRIEVTTLKPREGEPTLLEPKEATLPEKIEVTLLETIEMTLPKKIEVTLLETMEMTIPKKIEIPPLNTREGEPPQRRRDKEGSVGSRRSLNFHPRSQVYLFNLVFLQLRVLKQSIECFNSPKSL